MKKIGLVVLFGLAAAWLFAAGVLVNRENSAFQIAHLDRCSYDVGINNQVAEVKVLNTFRNMTNGMIYPRFYFPLPRGASATTLRWHSNNQWHTAYIAGLPQNPQGGPSTFPDNFVIYIQLMPVVFDIPDSLAAQDSLSVELTYVQMLNYNFGSVTLNLKNNYSGMQAQPLALQSLDIDITSDKQILGFEILDINDQSSHTTHSATGHYSVQ
ncbi:MAG: hypothetical protein U1C33_08060, partial [Candidatus Cloacimonadaceae bacterium]|nr:hypothetical protein [Candidatus Cloacimonadaceae bacterium]